MRLAVKSKSKPDTTGDSCHSRHFLNLANSDWNGGFLPGKSPVNNAHESLAYLPASQRWVVPRGSSVVYQHPKKQSLSKKVCAHYPQLLSPVYGMGWQYMENGMRAASQLGGKMGNQYMRRGILARPQSSRDRQRLWKEDGLRLRVEWEERLKKRGGTSPRLVETFFFEISASHAFPFCHITFFLPRKQRSTVKKEKQEFRTLLAHALFEKKNMPYSHSKPPSTRVMYGLWSPFPLKTTLETNIFFPLVPSKLWVGRSVVEEKSFKVRAELAGNPICLCSIMSE